MLAEKIATTLQSVAHMWIVGGKAVQPQEEDVQLVLDEAAKTLYTEPIGTRLEVGGLIIEKRAGGHDVFCYLGSYE